MWQSITIITTTTTTYTPKQLCALPPVSLRVGAPVLFLPDSRGIFQRSGITICTKEISSRVGLVVPVPVQVVALPHRSF
jgi:hypothetical protein